MTLWELRANELAHIDSLQQSLMAKVSERLLEMGFSAGQAVRCLRRSPLQGPLVVQIGDCVYSLERDIAKQILLCKGNEAN